MNVRIWIIFIDNKAVLCWKLAPRWLGQESGHAIMGEKMGSGYLIGVHHLRLEDRNGFA